ncbi:MAG: hypothetical protein A2Y72_00070 [Chloroflexi bacterium RBG_13_53_26]|jgi:hypothetical protein|nr:MAG: hypothetical protein A2Y72_00070 [Chloroflexi bacterium RBG_13_53_26]
MGRAKEPQLVKTFVGMLTARLSLLPQVNSLLQERLGPIDIESDTLDFSYTRYYEEEMGTGLKRRFLGFHHLAPPDRLVEVKLFTNELEQILAEEGKRLVNLDPGYLTAAKVVLASTKDYAHRLYLGSGIYGEVALVYQGRRFQVLPWTYPDYRSEVYHRFFKQLRTAYLTQIAIKGT